MKSAVIVFPGSNCDRDAYVAIRDVLGSEPEMAWHGDSSLEKKDLIIVPGGFSYGDYLRCGSMAANSPLMKEVIKQANEGTKIIGICNGFQILTETGLLPGTLMRNKGLKFICRQIHMRVENNTTSFTRKYADKQVIQVPVAHNEGNYVVEDDVLKSLQDNDQVAFRYCDESGTVNDDTNPNGATDNIAGVLNKNKNILALMPHPERALSKLFGSDDGRGVFESLMG